MPLNLADTSKQESKWSKKSLIMNSNFGGENDFHPWSKMQFTEAVTSLLPKDFYPSFNKILNLHGKLAEHLTTLKLVHLPPLKKKSMPGQKHPKNRCISPSFYRLKSSFFPNHRFMNPEYFNTLFELRESIPELPKTFHIITAYNPMDEVLSITENLERNKKLKAKVLKLNHTAWEIMAMSQDKKHQESSFVTDAPQALSIALTIEYNQRAIFQVKEDNLMIISCSSPNRIFAVDRFSNRLLNHDKYRSWQHHSHNGNDSRNI